MQQWEQIKQSRAFYYYYAMKGVAIGAFSIMLSRYYYQVCYGRQVLRKNVEQLLLRRFIYANE